MLLPPWRESSAEEIGSQTANLAALGFSLGDAPGMRTAGARIHGNDTGAVIKAEAAVAKIGSGTCA